MGTYTDEARQLLMLVGGRDNIAAVSHCMTRMRFALCDESKADVKKIEELSVVKGSFVQAGQFQIIIGNEVPTFYNEFIALAGIDESSKEEVKKAGRENQEVLQRAMGAIAEVFGPIIPAIIAGGLILGFRNCIDSIAFFEGEKTLVQVSQFWAGVDSFLWLIGEGVFHTGIPVGICWSVMRRMGGTPILGIVLGLSLVSGQLLNAYSVAGKAAPVWDFDFVQVNMIGYQAQVLPAILAALTLGYLERFLRKICPEFISMVVVPFFSLVLAVMAAHFVLGPFGWWVGKGISSVVYAGITGPFNVMFAAIFGFLYAPLVITGLHHMSNAIDLQLIAAFSGTMLWPMIALSNIAQGSAVLGMAFLQRHDEDAQQVNIPSIISCYLGVTEPAMFGVNLKYRFPFLCAISGSAIAAVVCVFFHTTANAIGVGGIPGFLSIQPSYIGVFILCMLIAAVVPFCLTVLFGRKMGIGGPSGAGQLEKGGETTSAQKETVAADTAVPSSLTASAHGVLGACCKGTVVALEDVPDKVFSERILGDGIAIEPSEGIVYAPASGTVTAAQAETAHGIGLTLDNGVEVLIHVGLDTVNMGGKGFELKVKQGDTIAKGQVLLAFDRDAISKEGYKDVVMMLVVQSAAQQLTVTPLAAGVVDGPETDILSYE